MDPRDSYSLVLEVVHQRDRQIYKWHERVMWGRREEVRKGEGEGGEREKQLL